MSRPVEGKTPEVPTEEGPKPPPKNVNQNNATNAKKGYGSLTTKSGNKKPGYGSLTTKSGNKTGSTISPVVVPSQRDTSKSKDNNPEVQSSVNERAQEKKIASIVMRRFLVRYATFLVVFGCIICSCLILMRAVQHSLYTKNVWKMMKPPERVEFGNFAVTSSSETCNELMRPYLYGDKRVVEIATAMALCLLIAEPHNSGLGGQSIALYANPDKNECKQTTGSATLPDDLEVLLENIKTDARQNLIGEYVAAIPGEMRTFHGLLKLMKSGKETEAALHIYELLLENPDQYLPTSPSLAATLLADSNDREVIFRKDFQNFIRGDEWMPMMEGDLFRPKEENYRPIRDLLIKYKNTGKIEDPDPILPHYNAEEELGEPEARELNWKTVQSNWTNTLVDGKIVTSGTNDFCVPSTPATSSLVADALEGAYAVSFLKQDDALMKKENYKDAVQHLTRVFDLIKNASHVSEEQRRILLTLEKIRAKNPVHKDMPFAYGSNMFAIVDKKNQDSVVWVSSLGGSLGSFVTEKSSSIGLNNLLSNLGLDFSSIGENQNILQPLIASKGGKIKLAYAGSGGFLTRSMDIARMMYTIVFNVFLEIPLHDAISTPLVYPVKEGDQLRLEQTFGIPWRYMKYLVKKNDKENYATNDNADEDYPKSIDRAVAIEQTENGNLNAVYFDGTGTVMMPNGI